MRKRIQKNDNRRSDAPRNASASRSEGRSSARNFGDSSTGPRSESRGERKPFTREGSSDRPYTPRAPREGGERRPYNREGSSDRPYTPRAPREGGERRPYNREGSSDRPYTPRAPREEGERRAYNGKPFTPRAPREEFEGGDNAPKPYRRDGGDFEPRPERESRPSFEPKEERRSFTPREDGARRGKFSQRETFKSRNRHDEAPAFTPQYKLDRYKERAPAKIQKKIAQTERRGDEVRLNRFIANAGICSRRDADKLIEAGEIKVNNKVVTEMGYQVMPTDVVKYGNRRLNREKPAYVLLNKPKDFLTTTDDPQDRKTVMELVKNAGESRIYPVGRLDRNTTGLILLTNDGELADKLTHPSNEIEKIYQAELDKPLTDEDFEKIKEGLQLEDGEVKVDDLAKVTPDGYVIGVKIHSGKNRIVRRIFEHLGYEVTKLDRTTFAGLTKKDLPRGSWRYLTERELVKLKYLL
jgi:23S rRNA pseudouridine2605 synthase